jgi:chromosome segregation ATPase
MLKRLLGHLPVRPSRLRAAAEQLRKCEGRVTELKALLDKARAGSQEWKAKADEASQRAAAARDDVAQQAKQIERMQAQATRNEHQQAREMEQLRARVADLTDKRARDAADLRAHLSATERDLALAREHLMTIDVKLDILEGAANVLDGRTRTILAARSAPEPADSTKQ